MLIPTPFCIKVAVATLTITGLALGGFRVARTVDHYSGQTGKYIADSQTGCAYPALYVEKKNAKEGGNFVPADRQVIFDGRAAALAAGYRQCKE